MEAAFMFAKLRMSRLLMMSRRKFGYLESRIKSNRLIHYVATIDLSSQSLQPTTAAEILEVASSLASRTEVRQGGGQACGGVAANEVRRDCFHNVAENLT